MKFDGAPEWTITTVLPVSSGWYNLLTERLETESTVTATYTDDQIPMWVKAGAIIPMLNHNRQLSLLRAIQDPI